MNKNKYIEDIYSKIYKKNDDRRRAMEYNTIEKPFLE